MALDAILDAIRTAANTEIAEVRRAGHAAREEVLTKGHREAATVERTAARARDDAAALAAARIVNRARLVADRELRVAAEAVYQEVHAAAAARLAAYRATRDYEAFFEQLLEECLAVLPEATVLEVDPEDGDLARRVLARRSTHSLSLELTLETAGGLAIATGDGRLDNTFESRIGRGEVYLRQLVAATVPILRERTL